jgi:hypothetical protein
MPQFIKDEFLQMPLWKKPIAGLLYLAEFISIGAFTLFMGLKIMVVSMASFFILDFVYYLIIQPDRKSPIHYLFMWLWKTRYFQMELKFEINNKPYNVTYNWHCRKVLDGPNFGPGFILKERWKVSPPTNIVLKKIENDAVLLFRPVLYCGDEKGADTENYNAQIMVVDSVINPKLMQIYTQRTTRGISYDVSLKSGMIRRLEKSASDYVVTEEEKHLKQLLQENSHGYHKVSARILPESIWGRSDDVKKYFSNTEGIVIAPMSSSIRSDIVGRDGRNNFFPVNWKGIYPLSEAESPKVSLVQTGNIWRLPPNIDFGVAEIYYSQPDSSSENNPKHYDIGSPPTVTVDYDGTSIQVLSSQQVFDSKRKLLIQFINSYQPLPWIGNRE